MYVRYRIFIAGSRCTRSAGAGPGACAGRNRIAVARVRNEHTRAAGRLYTRVPMEILDLDDAECPDVDGDR